MSPGAAVGSGLTLQALGQAGFVLRAGGTALAIDPYLSDSVAALGPPGVFARSFPPPLAPSDLADLGAVLITHAHQDHCDPETLLPIAAASPRAKFFGPRPVVARLRDLGIGAGRVVLARVDQDVEVARGCRTTALPAAHYGMEPAGDGEPSYLGFVIRLGGVTLYHSGDTVLYDGLAQRVRASGSRVLLLPVNGRDREREQMGIVGNLSPDEAMTLAADVGAHTVVPMHNDLFAANSLPREMVVDAWRRRAQAAQCLFLSPGETQRLEPGMSEPAVTWREGGARGAR